MAEPGPALQYRRATDHPSADAVGDALGRTYLERRVSVIAYIYSKPERAEPDPVRLFADAFRIKTDKDGKHG